jgi:hypothetical protein
MQVRSFFENLIFSTAKLSATTTSGSNRIGTSFIYTLHDGERLYPFAVTNWHVVKGTERFSLTFPAGRGTAGALGGGMVAEFLSSEKDWIRHQDPSIDLACIPIAQAVEDSKATGSELFFRSLDPGMLMRQVHYSVVDAIEDVVVVGYPSGLIDPVHLLPIVRKGITATPLEVDYGGKPEFLVDASIFPGSSGSPVFLDKTHQTFTREDGTGEMIGTVFLVGVVSATFTRNDDATVTAIDIPVMSGPTVRSKQMIDIGVVIKAHCVQEMIVHALKGKGFITIAT